MLWGRGGWRLAILEVCWWRSVSSLPSFLSSGNQELHGVLAVQWGRASEQKGKQAFEEATGMKVRGPGLWLADSGILGASPMVWRERQTSLRWRAHSGGGTQCRRCPSTFIRRTVPSNRDANDPKPPRRTRGIVKVIIPSFSDLICSFFKFCWKRFKHRIQVHFISLWWAQQTETYLSKWIVNPQWILDLLKHSRAAPPHQRCFARCAEGNAGF